MCRECKTPYLKRYFKTWQAGGFLLERQVCSCEHCEITEFRGDTYPRCVRCNCQLPIAIIGVNDQVDFDDIWTNPHTGLPVRL